MSTYRRNVLVGVTVLAALVMLGWMIMRFGGQLAAPFAGETMKVVFKSDRADGISEGSGIFYKGYSVGRVLGVRLDDNLTDLWFDAEIEAKAALPAGMRAEIRQVSLLGSGARLELIASDEPTTERLKSKDVIPVSFVGLNFFPPELRTLSGDLAAVARQLKEADVVGNINKRLDEVSLVLAETRTMLENANKLVGDEKIRKDISTSIENVRVASENVKNVTARADKIAAGLEKAVENVDKTVTNTDAQITDLAKTTKARLEEVAQIVKQANEITAKINDGTGTAGKLINDPKLYQGLVETTTSLNATVKDLQRLVQQWEEEGVSLKLQ